MKTKAQLEIESAYITIMNVLKSDNVCLVNKSNKRTLSFFKGSGLWIIKDEVGVSLGKCSLFKDAIKELMKV